MASKMKIKKGDYVVVTSGRDKGKKGDVLSVRPDKGRVLVQGVNMIKRHNRPRPGQPVPVCEANENGRIAMQRWPTSPYVLIDDYLEFRYAENCGAAFGLMREASKTVRTLLFNVDPWDPTIFSTVVVTLTVTGLLASVIPARRATQVDPVDALTYD